MMKLHGHSPCRCFGPSISNAVSGYVHTREMMYLGGEVPLGGFSRGLLDLGKSSI